MTCPRRHAPDPAPVEPAPRPARASGIFVSASRGRAARAVLEALLEEDDEPTAPHTYDAKTLAALAKGEAP